MRKILIILTIFIYGAFSFAQTSAIEESFFSQGTNALSEGKTEEAIAAFQNCITLEEKEKGNCLTLLGEIFENQNKTEAAIEVYKKAFAIFTEENNDQKIAVTAAKLGDLHLKPTTFYRALEYYQKSLAVAEKINDDKIFTHSLNGLANVYENLYLYKEANSYRKQFQAAYKELEKEQRLAEIEELKVGYEAAIKDSERKILAQNEKLKSLEKIENETFSSNKDLLLPFSVGLLALLAVGLAWKSRKPANEVEVKPAPVQTAPVPEPAPAQKIIVPNNEEAEKRMESFKNIHENLRTGFAKINNLNEQIYQKTTHLPDVKYHSLIVKETTQKMLESSWDLIWALNPESTTVTSLVMRMREFAEDYLDESQIEPVFHIPENLPHIPISKESHSDIYLVVKEALTNVVNHSAASKVFFTINLHNNIFLSTIIDNGNGFVLTGPTSGKGIISMKERLEKLNATLEITSKIGQGTMISISVALDEIKA